MTPCTIKDYLLNIEKTDVDDVYESHDVVFDVLQFHIDSEADSTLISRLRKSHPSGRSFSYGNLNLNIQKFFLLQIAIGKNFTGSTLKQGSIKNAIIALSITM